MIPLNGRSNILTSWCLRIRPSSSTTSKTRRAVFSWRVCDSCLRDNFRVVLMLFFENYVFLISHDGRLWMPLRSKFSNKEQPQTDGLIIDFLEKRLIICRCKNWILTVFGLFRVLKCTLQTFFGAFWCFLYPQTVKKRFWHFQKIGNQNVWQHPPSDAQLQSVRSGAWAVGYSSLPIKGNRDHFSPRNVVVGK